MTDLLLIKTHSPTAAADGQRPAASDSTTADEKGFAAMLASAPGQQARPLRDVMAKPPAPTESGSSVIATNRDPPSVILDAGQAEAIPIAVVTEAAGDTDMAAPENTEQASAATGNRLPAGGKDRPLRDLDSSSASGVTVLPVAAQADPASTARAAPVPGLAVSSSSGRAGSEIAPVPRMHAAEIDGEELGTPATTRTVMTAQDRLTPGGVQTSNPARSAESASGAGLPEAPISSPAPTAAANAETMATALRLGSQGNIELRSAESPLPGQPATETGTDRGPRIMLQQAAGQPGWSEEVRGTLQWLSRQGVHRAELQLHPAELGAIDVQITSENEQTNVVFVAASRAARDLLEAELPRLREMFAQAGVELGQTEVSGGDREKTAQTHSDAPYDGGHKTAIKELPEPVDTPEDAMGSLTAGDVSPRGVIDFYV